MSEAVGVEREVERPPSVLFGVPMPEPGTLTAGQRWTAALALVVAALLLAVDDGGPPGPAGFLASPGSSATPADTSSASTDAAEPSVDVPPVDLIQPPAADLATSTPTGSDPIVEPTGPSPSPSPQPSPPDEAPPSDPGGGAPPPGDGGTDPEDCPDGPGALLEPVLAPAGQAPEGECPAP